MMTPYQRYIALSRYARYLPDECRRETWEETVNRYCSYFENRSEDFPKERTFAAINSLDVMPSMRALMTAGKALDRDNVAGFNCSYVIIDDVRAFDESLYILMNGCGLGFSVERQYIAKLPEISEDFFESDTTIKVRDSKIGWATAFRELIGMLYGGKIPKWDLSSVRPSGSPLKTFGGRSSGPGPLNDLFVFSVNLFRKAAGRKLNSVECHDLMCKIADVVVVGGVRRSALISLSNLSDDRMRHAKTGQWWIDEPQRSLANNSVAYTEKPSISQFMTEWVSLYDSKSGERGIINRVAAKKKIKSLGDRRKADFDAGVNPCLSGDTMVYVADGRGNVTIKELAEEGKDIPVFCYDDKKNIVIRTMRNPRITGVDVPVFNVTLDDGSVIRATENHKFLTKNDGYKELKDLITGESLDIITKFEASIKDIFPKSNSNSQDYWWITKNGVGKKSEHRLIAENDYNGIIPPGYVVHHKNFNAQDNSPNNLQIMSKADHDRLHGDHMRGENNPMVRAKTDWSDEKWVEYKNNLSKAVSGELNGRYSGVSNEELRNHAINLTKQLSRRFTLKDWIEYAKQNNIPTRFSKWREDHLGGVLGLAKSCALELGIDHADVDPRVVASYKIAVDAGYDAVIVNGEVKLNKKCEGCGKEFQTTYARREFGMCSNSCANKKAWESEELCNKLKDSLRVVYDERRKNNRELQTKVYSDLKFTLGRDPQKNEWIMACKEQNISCEISRKSSPFTSYNQLKDSATMYNHKIVSVEFCGNETVYNGTVDEYHNFFVGSFNGILPNGKKKVTYINNLQCGEIILRPAEFCNLTEVIIREEDTLETLKNKVELATILGTYQSTLTDFRYLRSIWKKNVEEERLLGVSLTGIMDHPILSNVNDTAIKWLTELRELTVETNKIWAKKLNINPSAAITTVKPSGTVSQLVDSSSGIHPRMSKYYVRTVRNDKKDPLSDFLISSGVPHETDCIKESNWVFSFPIKSPSNCRLASEMTAIDQLEHYMMFNKYWCEHNPSITVYVRENEWLDVAAYVYKNFDNINGVSFLPYSDTIYKQAPYQPITEDEFITISKTFPVVDFDLYNINEHEDNTVGTQTLACVSGICEI